MTTVCFPFVGDLVGGSHLSSVGLITRLDEARFRPLVLLQSRTGAIADLLTQSGIAFEAAPTSPPLKHGHPVRWPAALRLLAAAPRLATVLRRRNVQIVHCNDGRTLATWALPAKLAGTKLLWHHRGSPHAAGLRLLAPLLADRVVAVSHFAKPPSGRYSARGRTHVIHSPFDVDITYDRTAARAEVAALLPQCGPATRIIGFSGALIERKRPLLFVEAIAALRRQSRDVARDPARELDIRGVLFGGALDGMDRRVTARAAELGVSEHIHLAGFRSPGPKWLAGCDLLLVPAVDEPFGRTLIEAMLVGTPVVATGSGGNVEAIRHGLTGLLVPPEDAERLAAACLGLLTDPIRYSRIAALARLEASCGYGAAAHANAVMALYDQMLAEPGRTPSLWCRDKDAAGAAERVVR